MLTHVHEIVLMTTISGDSLIIHCFQDSISSIKNGWKESSWINLLSRQLNGFWDGFWEGFDF